MIKVLITGASGFAGSHLVEHLMNRGGYEVYGTVFGPVMPFLSAILPEDHQLALNLLHREEVLTKIRSLQPEWIFHLAALSSPTQSFTNPNSTYTNNIEGQLNLLDAARSLSPLPKVMVVGTAEEYGKVGEAIFPLNEETPLNPVSPYAVSKVATDFMGLMYHHAYSLPVIRVRPFNHIGERQTDLFVCPAFAKQIALIEAGKQAPVIEVGNLSTIRDFTDVKDMVQAYELALIKGVPGEVYNLGSGIGITIETLLNELLALATKRIEIKVDPNRYVPADVPKLISDSQKFMNLSGWQPQINLSVTLKRVLDYWRGNI